MWVEDFICQPIISKSSFLNSMIVLGTFTAVANDKSNFTKLLSL